MYYLKRNALYIIQGVCKQYLNASKKVATDSVCLIIREYRCTGTVKRKLIKVNCCDTRNNFYRPSRARPVFRLDPFIY